MIVIDDHVSDPDPPQAGPPQRGGLGLGTGQGGGPGGPGPARLGPGGWKLLAVSLWGP